jgi:DNA-binding Lrp family transcriptional regulator
MYFRADVPVRQVAEETGLREGVIRGCIARLLERKAIELRPFINPFAVGLCEFQALISTHGMEPQIRQKLLQALVESQYSTYVGAIGGDFHLAVMLVARDVAELNSIFDAMNGHVGNTPYEREVSSCSSISFYAPKYLQGNTYGPPSLTYGPVEQRWTIDDLDQRLLFALGELKSISISELARAVGAPATTINYRLSGLKEKGILLGVGYALPPLNDGLLPFALQVRAASISPSIRAQMRQYCATHPAISYMIEGAGSWEFQIGIRLTDMRQSTAVAEDIRRTFAPHVTKVTTIPVYDTLKVLPYPLMAVWPCRRSQVAAG